jgi:hypothetical protein
MRRHVDVWRDSPAHWWLAISEFTCLQHANLFMLMMAASKKKTALHFNKQKMDGKVDYINYE